MRHLLGLGSLGFLALSAASAHAQWIMPPEPPPDRMRPIPSVRLEEVRSEIDVRDQVATRTSRLIFFNPGGPMTEATCFLPLDPKVQIHGFSVSMGGQTLRGEILDSEKSRSIYEEIVRRKRDPALLETYGSQLLRVRVFPVPANGRFELNVQTTELLKAEDGLVRVVALAGLAGGEGQAPEPESFGHGSGRSGVRASFRADLRSSVPLRNVFSPGHDIAVTRPSDREARISYETPAYTPGRPVVFYYGQDPGEIGVNVLTYRDGPEGTFLLLLSPGIAADPERVLPKDVVFVVDTSGSMQEGGKIEQAKKALAYCVSKLNPSDRFNVISFSHAARPWQEAPVAASPENVQGALAFIGRLQAAGGTAIHEALTTALDQILGAGNPETGNRKPETDGRVAFIAFLTDGLPTIGETDPDRILRDVAARARGRVRICSFGVGFDVNTRLLDALTFDGEGATDYVLPQEDIEIRVSSFYDKIGAPVLADVRIRVSGVEVDDLYPRNIGHLYRGGQIAVMGRFRQGGQALNQGPDGRGSGQATIELTGREGRKERTLRFPARFEGGSSENDFLPRLWAGKKVLFLLNEIRINGANRELVDEVVKLSTRYGIVTPYTSFLITEDQPLPVIGGAIREGGRRAVEDELRKDAAGAFKGAESVERAKSLQSANGPAAPPASAAPLAGMAQKEADKRGLGRDGVQQFVQEAGAKTCYQRSRVWYDSSLEEKDLTAGGQTLAFGSEAYFKLLREHPELAKVLALGQQVSFKVGGQVVNCR